MGGIVAHIMGLLVVALATWGGLVLYKVLNRAKNTVQNTVENSGRKLTEKEKIPAPVVTGTGGVDVDEYMLYSK